MAVVSVTRRGSQRSVGWRDMACNSSVPEFDDSGPHHGAAGRRQWNTLLQYSTRAERREEGRPRADDPRQTGKRLAGPGDGQSLRIGKRPGQGDHRKLTY